MRTHTHPTRPNPIPSHLQLDSVPVVHGSALFSRGETQSLCTVTVGRRQEQQKTESLLGGETSKRLFVNYAFPPYAVDDTSNGGWGCGGDELDVGVAVGVWVCAGERGSGGRPQRLMFEAARPT